jgi:hypothetical protein
MCIANCPSIIQKRTVFVSSQLSIRWLCLIPPTTSGCFPQHPSLFACDDGPFDALFAPCKAHLDPSAATYGTHWTIWQLFWHLHTFFTSLHGVITYPTCLRYLSEQLGCPSKVAVVLCQSILLYLHLYDGTVRQLKPVASSPRMCVGCATKVLALMDHQIVFTSLFASTPPPLHPLSLNDNPTTCI